MGKEYVKFKDKHKIIDNVEYKLCPDCNEWYPMDEQHFKVQPSQKDGYSKRCRTCQESYNHNRYMKMGIGQQLKFYKEEVSLHSDIFCNMQC